MAASITVDMKDAKKFERELGAFAHKAIPHAIKNTLNRGAFLTMKTAKQKLPSQMILRNKFAQQSIQVDPNRTLAVSRMAATVGSTQDFMKDQELGGTKVKKGKHGVPIPTSFSAGEAPGKIPRRRLPRKRNSLRGMNLAKSRQRKRGQPRSRKQKTLFKIQDAITSGRRTIFLDSNGNRKAGIFRVVGGRKTFKRGYPKGAKLRRLYSFDNPSVRIPKNAWLTPAVDRVVPLMPKIHVKSIQFQMDRQRLFR